MHTYYLFIIKKEVVRLYDKNTYILFEILKNLFELEEKNLVYGVSVFHQLCIPISKRLLSSYIMEKIPVIKLDQDTYKILSFFEHTILKINHANIIVKTDTSLPRIYKIFHVYHENIFVCDFSSSHFFWLDKALKKETLK